MGKTLILIDGHALVFRQYYALERTDMRAADGTPTWAVYGFFKAIFDLLNNKNIKADAIAVAFDLSHDTFRTAAYSEYKSNRSAMPDDMSTQMELIYEGLNAFSIPIYTKKGYEADDVIGTISREACELGHKVLILTGDYDSFQLIDKNGCIKVIIPSKGELLEYDWDKVYEKLGVYPDQIVDYKSLRGDTSDCIPGIYGIGPKTAQSLLARYGSLENILADCENIKEPTIKTKVCAGKEQAKLSKYLATIVRDLDVEFDFEKTHIVLPDLAIVSSYLKKYQFHKFLKEINEILTTFDRSKSKTGKCEVSQLNIFSDAVASEINKNCGFSYSKKLITDSEDLANLVQNLKQQSFIGFKVYADFINAITTTIRGFSFSYCADYSADSRIHCGYNSSEIETFYIPISHSNIENHLRYEDVVSVLKQIFEDKNIKKTTFDLKNQYNILRNCGIFLEGVIFDVYLASYVKDSGQNHELDAQTLNNLDFMISDFTNSDKKNSINFENASSDKVLTIVADEVSSILKLSSYWVGSLDEKELNLVYDIEVPLSIVLAEMEHNGVSVDVDYLTSLTSVMDEKLKALEFDIYNVSGCSFNINSPKQVSEVLYVKLGLSTKKKRGKDRFSTSAAILEELSQEYEIAGLILKYRKYAKLKSTYTEALPELISPIDNKIHTTYNQAVTLTGRLSSSNPNLQNIPVRTDDGNKIRSAFIAGDKQNGLILSADYSQIELRLLAHISGDKNLLYAFQNDIDIHTITASKIYNTPVDQVTKLMRMQAKAVNFGIVYGQSKYGLAKNLGISNDEAAEFITRYFATYPGIKDYMDSTVEYAKRNGYVETIFGRKRYLEPEFASSNAAIREFGRRAAINQPIQGSAADLMKIAMIDFYKKLKENNLKSKMIIQVHDEIVMDVCKPELELVTTLVKDSMENCCKLSVPLCVDIYTGESWQEK